jgi:pimeloyl-ACP methyl ester carboxylesterase
LIVTGKFDPITPTVNGEMALETLSNGMLVESPIAGHDPLSTSGTCGIDIVQAFLNHPRADVDASCLDGPGIDFSPT